MTLAQFIAEMIKCLSEFQFDWSGCKDEWNLKDKMTFADWLAIFSEYALKVEAENEQPF